MIVGYAYPWDFDGDPAAAPRAAELGCDVVALAATYHASRTPSPLHPTRRVFEVPTSAAYVALRPEAWRGQRLAPTGPSWPGGETAYENAVAALRAEGLAVAAWIVVTHHDELGLANPDLVVRNAYGDPYSYALCPSSPEVVEYAVTLVGEVVATGAEHVVLEACGPMGVVHSGVHDKLEYAAFDGAARDLLSICFCSSCARRFDERGLDADDLARAVRRALSEDVRSLEEALGDDVAGVLRATRAAVAADLQRAVLERIAASAPGVGVTIHASMTPGATGSFVEIGAEVLARVSSVVANAWDERTALTEITALATRAGDATPVGAYLRLDRGWAQDDLSARVASYRRAGVSEWHLYHLGLVSGAGLATARRVVEAARSGEGSS